MKRYPNLRWLVLCGLFLCALLPRWQLAGRIPAIQPQWALRSQWFWQALGSGELHDTYIAPHPGLTVMWYAGAAQRLHGDATRFGRVLASSRANAVVATLLILVAVWQVRRVLSIDGVDDASAIAFLFGLLLALDPLNILMTGLIGLDGPVSLMMLVAFLAIVLHRRRGRKTTLLTAGLATGLAVATKVPGLLLLPLPLALWPIDGRRDRGSGRRAWLTLGVLVAGAVLVTWALLPAAWTDPVRIGRDLLVGKGPRDESFREVLTQGHQQFFMGRTSMNPGVWFHPVQLLYRATPLALLGTLCGLCTPWFRNNRLARETLLLLFVVLLGLTVSGKKTWRYISPAIVLLDLVGAIGLWSCAKALVARWRRPAWIAAVWAAIALQGIWVLSAAPYYGLRFNPLLGGARTAAKVIPVGAGEGLEQALDFLEGEARRLDRRISWSGGYGSNPFKRKALEFESEWLDWRGKNRNFVGADCHLFYISEVQRGRAKGKRADHHWQRHGVEVLSVVEHGVELVRVKCEADLGIDSCRR